MTGCKKESLPCMPHINWQNILLGVAAKSGHGRVEGSYEILEKII